MDTLTINDRAEFTWGFGEHFFLATDKGFYEWSNPQYGGTNTIHKFDGNYDDWCAARGIAWGRDKGTHTIRDYCGSDVKVEVE